MSTPLWQPDDTRIGRAALSDFIDAVADDWDLQLEGYDALWAWSVAQPVQFWLSLRDFCGVIAERWGDTVVEEVEGLPGARWFPGARLNFAENLLCPRAADDPALVFFSEDRVERRFTHAALCDEVSRVAQALLAAGVQPGDRVAALLPNMPEAVFTMLGAAAIGATFTSCSPDFGVQGVLDRFGQVGARVLVAADGYYYKGRWVDTLDKLAEVAAGLPTLEQVVVTSMTGGTVDLEDLPRACTWASWLAPHAAGPVPYVRLPFDHPLYILYSSGTTGAPKCIVHGAGGTLLAHLKEHRLHCDVRPGDRVFYFTTCGWMMWNWLVSALASRATVVLYDGSPFHPGPTAMWDLAQQESLTLFGTSAKYIDAVGAAGIRPIDTHDLADLRLICSTGSPLVPEGFDVVYQRIKADVQLASVSGGTDIIGCFVLGNPIGPVWRGEIQARALGMAVDVFDPDGQPLVGRPGELVCTAPFPNMPVFFWNDPDGERYHGAYFARFPGVWCHGDWAELTDHGGVIIHGRSDATLNPGGVRIGTAEIYRVVEQLDGVVEAVAVGQRWQGDVRVVLFLRLTEGRTLDKALVDAVCTALRQQCSPRHVPARVLQVADIPRTRSGKITELAVRRVVHGETVRNLEALANPEALDHYRDRPELQG